MKKIIIVLLLLIAAISLVSGSTTISDTSMSFQDDINGSSRFTLKNINNGTDARTFLTVENDNGNTMSMGIASSTFVLGTESFNNATGLLSRSQGDMLFINTYNKPFRWFNNPSNDDNSSNIVEVMELDGKLLNASTINITAQNVFIPQYIFVHTNETMSIIAANNWTNVSFSQENAEIKKGISHTFNDITNDTFKINTSGIYNLEYDFDLQDTSVSASDIDVAGRIIFTNGTEIEGSVFETDIIKQAVEVELSHHFLAELSSGDEVIFQFVATDADVEISTHGTYGDHKDSATISITKIANLPIS